MTKHRKCKECNGRGVVLRENFDSKKRRFTIREETCYVCRGTGFEEVKDKDKNDIDGCIIYGD